MYALTLISLVVSSAEGPFERAMRSLRSFERVSDNSLTREDHREVSVFAFKSAQSAHPVMVPLGMRMGLPGPIRSPCAYPAGACSRDR